MQAISEGIYYENGYPGVTLGAIITARGTLLIDAPLRAEDARTWKSVLLTQGRGTHRLLVYMDGHTDRTVGARPLECTIVASQATADLFDNRTTVFKGQNIESSAQWENYPEIIGSRWARPHITFTEQLCIHWGEPKIMLYNRPGPMPGAIWVDVPAAKVVFVGDAVITNQPPFLAEANIPIWIETLDRLLARDYRDYVIVSGRGGPVALETVREQRKLLKYIDQRLESLAHRSAIADATESLVQALSKDLTFPSKHEEFYIQRLRYSIQQYYTRYYFPTNLPDEEKAQ